ncbi:hypothetical protein [Povalibacter sp.]|uniref:hypothetical protein n=1 Tax=Povalibacter sp. TaxID=1962978 RepID=UPI002F408D9C
MKQLWLNRQQQIASRVAPLLPCFIPAENNWQRQLQAMLWEERKRNAQRELQAAAHLVLPGIERVNR